MEELMTSPIHDDVGTHTDTDIEFTFDVDLDLFTQVDYSCLDFLTPTSSRRSSDTAPASTETAGADHDTGDVHWPRPMDRDIHGRSELKRTAPQWAIRVRWVLSKDFEQDSSAAAGQWQWWDEFGNAWARQPTSSMQRRPSVVDRRYSYGRKIQGGRGRRPSDFSIRSGRPPAGLAVHYEEDDIPFELTLCSEKGDGPGLYRNLTTT
jgi:hypothetical protein